MVIETMGEHRRGSAGRDATDVSAGRPGAGAPRGGQAGKQGVRGAMHTPGGEGRDFAGVHRGLGRPWLLIRRGGTRRGVVREGMHAW